jgi:peptidase M49-like protein
MRRTLICLAGLAALAFATAALAADKKAPAKTPGKELRIVSDIEKRVAQFAPTPLHADVSGLTAEDRKVLDKLVQASRLLNEIFLRQAWTGNPAMRERLRSYTGPHAAAVRQYFDINFGPWDRLAEREPFVGDKPRPKGAGYYPEDLTKEAFDDWVARHPADKDKLTSTVTVVRRAPNGGLVAVPYSREYAEWLEPAARLLREAAALTSNASLKRFLSLRADAFESDDYYVSDVAWMDLDAPVEVTIGPYETYEDDLFGYKAAFESFVTVNLPKESAALARYKERLPWLEKNLPIPDEDKNLHRGTDSPIRVVDTWYGAGETRAAVQTVAFNLPNDERVREAKGSKKVLLHNIMRAKYDKILIPIAHQVLDPAQVKDVSFDAYFNEILHHELSHGLGPGTITVNGRKTEVRLELKELFSTLEEAKADVMGVYNILALIDQKEMPASLRHSLEPTYVAGLFRSARFGVDEAHGQGVVAQLNYLTKKGALVTDAQGRVRAVSEKFPGAIRDLLHDMLMLQARGDYNGTKQFLETYGKPTQGLRDAIGRLKAVPVDIKPVYAAEK